MRKFLLIYILFGGISSLYAQIGIKVGVNFNTVRHNKFEMNDVLRGINAGTTLDIPISKRIAFQTGLIWSSKGYLFHTYRVNDYKTRINYLELPLIFAFSKAFPDNFIIYTSFGSYIAMALSGNIQKHYLQQNGAFMNGSKNLVFNDTNMADFTRYDWGGVFNVGIQFYNVRFNCGYDLGLRNIGNKHRTDIIKNRSFITSVAYILE